MSHMNILGIIPARYASTRFPGKALCIIDGKSMIQRVYEQAKQCDQLTRILVATDHEMIESHVKGFGGDVVMTSEDHQSGTERCAEAIDIVDRDASGNGTDIVINIQGDEPFINPRQIAEVISCFDNTSTGIATLARKINAQEDIFNPNVVKVVFDDNHIVLYFSRSAIPAIRDAEPGTWLGHGTFYKHIGIYGYRTAVLKQLVELPATSLEKSESLEQLRWLQHGFSVSIRETSFRSISIDTPADLQKLTNKTS